MRLKPKLGDFFIILLIAASAVFLTFSLRQADTGEKIALIIQDGVVVKQIRLDTLEHTEILEYSGEYPGIIEAEKGRIRFKEATCPDQVCVGTGWISKNGQIAACLPDRILIRITGTGSAEDDTDIWLH
ncbi:MAG TPA: NusG domain II-containing protein [Thermoclostridium caenicola]|uniref:Uncharacterized protein n=1 Tax=Thermoclostridium caenicola TaxID=659425 RepID=A0A1M6J8H1_9FIRM|nr:NusG domain II-containing protein [Thermoclostridium caenicola]SHJ42964.1 hypothetical protein SAMN05444373_105315 [Thermoclostridium caenicola]HOK42873.1 NusG domain II-containing protein [Thermoclostridium caenicola]HOL84503.1 NusG domain II-containing protein [Thermoclostridium caenicola]HOP72277.1 NusG domain II-containing protein [Thermoclostridium caenicola]HPO76406.1 NusG domain II-containing protein [Thermoclostridium caenicola]